MEEKRSSPESFLRQIEKEENKKKIGKLKIFFGYAAGVGKTYGMLKSAHDMKKRGVDVVIGYVEPHSRPKTNQLIKGLETLSVCLYEYGGITLREFDLDAAIRRKPGLILVDELAHTNAPGSRHLKRYQDVLELLKNGIDVYTTLNVQHIESLNDLVASITGVTVKERIPDSVFDDADQVELVDIEPNELIERLNEGEIYKKTQAEKALGSFFTVANLVALREIALRRCADRVNKMSDSFDGRSNTLLTDEHVLVCLSTSPANPKIIRTAARMAKAFRAGFTALFVETPDFSSISEENRKRLRQNIHLAQQLGATIETVYGEDIAFQISEFARFSGVTKIVLGRSSFKRKMLISRPSLTEKITLLAPNLDIYIIPDQNEPLDQMKKYAVRKSKWDGKDFFKTMAILGLSTLFGLMFDSLGYNEVNIITVYILGVLIIAVVSSHRIFSLASSLISVFLFDFLFIDPRFTFQSYDAKYLATFPIMFIAAFLTSSLAVRIQQQAKQSAEMAYRTKVLFDANRSLSGKKDSEGIISVTCAQLTRLLNRDIIFYGVENDELIEPLLFYCQENSQAVEYLTENEWAVASWVLHNNKHAGATTDTLGSSKCLYLSVRVAQDVFGVVGIAIHDKPLDTFENSIMLSILGECALALKNEKVSKERKEAALLAKNEQLRANLLRSISHDLRTPLTSISGNAAILLSDEANMNHEKKKKLYENIYEDSLWLINLVENLLSVTRIEDGTMKLRLTTELLNDIVAEAVQNIKRHETRHYIEVRYDSSYILVKADVRLIVQVIINLVDNAVKYTPFGSHIVIETRREGSLAVVSVSDDGYGLSDEDKKHVFEMFYTAETNISDSRRSLGLGLSLCKSIITAHDGNISVKDNMPHGAVFTFTLPIKEADIHE